MGTIVAAASVTVKLMPLVDVQAGVVTAILPMVALLCTVARLGASRSWEPQENVAVTETDASIVTVHSFAMPQLPRLHSVRVRPSPGCGRQGDDVAKIVRCLAVRGTVDAAYVTRHQP